MLAAGGLMAGGMRLATVAGDDERRTALQRVVGWSLVVPGGLLAGLLWGLATGWPDLHRVLGFGIDLGGHLVVWSLLDLAFVATIVTLLAGTLLLPWRTHDDA